MRENAPADALDSVATEAGIDPGLFRRVAAFEVARARRYGHPISLVTFPVPAHGPGPQLRETDILGLARDRRAMVALLPETDRAGAERMLERIGIGEDGARATMIASFPADAYGVEDLLERSGA